MANLEQRAN